MVKKEAESMIQQQPQRKELARRSEILFYYDARMCNPNGDPDNNEPRLDDVTGRLHVTEFRLKRTTRKYIKEVIGRKILLEQVPDYSEEGQETGGFKLLGKLAQGYTTEVEVNNGGDGKKKSKTTAKVVDKDRLLNDHIDIKLFGILFAVPGGGNFKQIGPVQFGMGQSLNKIATDDIIRIGMTSLVPNTKEKTTGLSKGGSFGEKYIVRYAFIQFHGFVNNNVAKDVDLTEEDVQTMLTAIWNGTDNLSTSSKFGQKSRLLVKVNYKDNGYIGDLDLTTKLERIDEEQEAPLENITQVKLNVDNLLKLIENNKDIIESIEYEYNPMLLCKQNPDADFEKIITDWSEEKKINVKRMKLN